MPRGQINSSCSEDFLVLLKSTNIYTERTKFLLVHSFHSMLVHITQKGSASGDPGSTPTAGPRIFFCLRHLPQDRVDVDWATDLKSTCRCALCHTAGSDRRSHAWGSAVLVSKKSGGKGPAPMNNPRRIGQTVLPRPANTQAGSPIFRATPVNGRW